MELAQPVKIPVERQTEEVWAFISLKFHNGDEDKEKANARFCISNNASM